MQISLYKKMYDHKTSWLLQVSFSNISHDWQLMIKKKFINKVAWKQPRNQTVYEIKNQQFSKKWQ